MEYKNISKTYNLGNGVLIGIDQTNSNADKTCLCIAKFKNGVMDIKGIRYIKKQEDIDKYINENLSNIYKAFKVNNTKKYKSEGRD